MQSPQHHSFLSSYFLLLLAFCFLSLFQHEFLLHSCAAASALVIEDEILPSPSPRSLGSPPLHAPASIFYSWTTRAPWTERDSFRFFILQQPFEYIHVRTQKSINASVGSWFIYGGRTFNNGLNDVWVSDGNYSTKILSESNSQIVTSVNGCNNSTNNSTWDIAAGVNQCIPPQPSASPDTFPPSDGMLFCEDRVRFQLFSMSVRSKFGKNTIYTTQNGLKWHSTVAHQQEALNVADANCMVVSHSTLVIVGGLRQARLNAEIQKPLLNSSNAPFEPSSDLSTIEARHLEKKVLHVRSSSSNVSLELIIEKLQSELTDGFQLSNDVYASGNGGNDWVHLDSAPWSARSNPLTLVLFNNTKYHSITYLIGGEVVPHEVNVSTVADQDFIDTNTGANRVLVNAVNDVWVSTNDGQSWNLICERAPWKARNRLAGAVNLNGTIIVSSGWAFSWNIPSTIPSTAALLTTINPRVWYYDDIWLSFDGGFSWQECQPNTDSFETTSTLQNGSVPLYGRASAAMAVDSDGYLILSGGYRSFLYYSDIIRSKFSFYDLDAVAKYCALYLPPSNQPIGLTCLPGDVDCPPPPPQNSNSSSSSSSTGSDPILPSHPRETISKGMQAFIFVCCLVVTSGVVGYSYLYCTRRSVNRQRASLPPVALSTPYARLEG